MQILKPLLQVQCLLSILTGSLIVITVTVVNTPPCTQFNSIDIFYLKDNLLAE